MSRLVYFIFLLQQSISFATLSGHIEDSSGAAVVGAIVQVVNLDRNQSSLVQTDAAGRFRVPYLTSGEYEVRLEQLGFEKIVRKVTLSIGQTVDVPITLNVAGIVESVAVTSDAPVIDTVRTQVADTIFPKEIDALPLNGRNFLDLALLVPAVSRTNTGNSERFAETSAVPGTGISIAGQRNLGNSFVVDGLSANDDAADLPGTFISPEAIREFQIVRSGGIAEFGRAYGGVINVITRSGTNDWHGKAYGFLRDHRVDATNVFAATDPMTGRRIRSPLTQGQYGVTLDGPLRRDRAFMFANLEREDLHRSGFISISPDNVSTINAALDRFGYAPSRLATGEYPTGDKRTSVFARTDYDISSRNRLAGRYEFYDIDSPNARNVGALSAVSRGTVVADRDQTFAFNDLISVSSRSMNETRFQFRRSRFAAPGNDLIGPAVSVSGVANFGASTSSPTERDINSFEIANNYSTLQHEHYLKGGVDVLYNRVNIVFPASIYGSYSFSSLPNFLAGNYTTFTQAFGKTDWFQTNPNLGWFLQDEWRPRNDLTINAGIRHDVEWLAQGIRTRGANFAPRVGIAYSPGSHKTVVRSGFGIYYDRIPLRAIANALRGTGVDYESISLQRTQQGAPAFPDKLASVPSGVLLNLATIDTAIKSAASIQTNLEIQREVRRGTSVSAGYLYLRGLHIIMQRNLNVPALTAAQDPVNLGRPNANFGNISQYSGQGDSYYSGLTLSLDQRASNWASVRFSYTLSKAIDDSGNAFFSSPQNNFNIRDDRGLSDNDQRHRVAVSGQLVVPRLKLALNPIFTYTSGYPFNIVTGGQTLQTTAARLAGVGRNTGQGFSYESLDLRVSRKFRVSDRVDVELLAESFNTTNRVNFQFPNNTLGTGMTPLPAFGKATAAGDPRQIQFGLRCSF